MTRVKLFDYGVVDCSSIPGIDSGLHFVRTSRPTLRLTKPVLSDGYLCSFLAVKDTGA